VRDRSSAVSMKFRNARQRADHDRGRLWQALVEQGNAGKG
jgi:hypothetical protein